MQTQSFTLYCLPLKQEALNIHHHLQTSPSLLSYVIHLLNCDRIATSLISRQLDLGWEVLSGEECRMARLTECDSTKRHRMEKANNDFWQDFKHAPDKRTGAIWRGTQIGIFITVLSYCLVLLKINIKLLTSTKSSFYAFSKMY